LITWPVKCTVKDSTIKEQTYYPYLWCKQRIRCVCRYNTRVLPRKIVPRSLCNACACGRQPASNCLPRFTRLLVIKFCLQIHGKRLLPPYCPDHTYRFHSSTQPVLVISRLTSASCSLASTTTAPAHYYNTFFGRQLTTIFTKMMTMNKENVMDNSQHPQVNVSSSLNAEPSVQEVCQLALSRFPPLTVPHTLMLYFRCYG